MNKKSVFSNSKGMLFLKIGVILICIAAAIIIALNFFKPKKEVLGFQKGMGYVSWSKDGYNSVNSNKSLEKLKEVGVDWVCVVVTWYQSSPWSGDIHKTEKTPSDGSLIHLVRKIHELDMKVMFKPHLDILDKSDGGWRGEIGCVKDEDWIKWFEKYEEYILYYINLLKEEKVDIFCLGTELSTTATIRPDLWRELILKVRENYNGFLTYAAHWDRYFDIRFWDLLDYVGINAYFPLTDKMLPTYEELKQGWSKWIKEMEEFQKRVNKPIIFPEIGCNSAEGAAIRPWEHIPRSEVNLKIQEDYYKVIFDVFLDKDWFYGAYWWYWGTNIWMGGKYNRGFTMQNKPSEDVLKKWYNKKISRAKEF